MRVIAGTARGRKLRAPQGDTTRPTPDKVREALFSIIAAHVPGARVLDVFAGSGALGIEAISRGAAAATFVEQARAALVALRGNIEVLGPELASACHVEPGPAAAVLGRLGRRGEAFDLVLVDPPYAAAAVPATLAALLRHALLREDALVVAEHLGGTPSPPGPPGLACTQLKRYGDVSLSFYTRGSRR